MVFLDKNEKLKGLLKRIKTQKGIIREIATKEFLDFYNPFMLGIFYSNFKKNINLEEMEDLSSEILMRLLDKKCEINENVLGYIYRTAVNSYLNFLRSKNKKHFFEEYSLNLPSASFFDYPDLLTDLNMKKEKFYKFHKNFRSQSVQRQFSLWLQGYSHKEIADLCEVNTGTSKSNLSKIRKNEARIFLQ
jgi:RNA polymerase sigma factor (sigma-70 family)